MPRFNVRAASVLFTALVLSASARAQSLPLSPPNAAPLTLEEAMARALKKNFDLRIQGFNSDLARESLEVAKTDFLPTLTGSTNRTLSRSTTTVAQPDGSLLTIPRDSNSTSFSVGVSERVPQTNGTVSVSSNVSRNSNQRPEPFSSDATVQISQPLLKNAGPTVAKANIERAKIGVSVASLDYRSRVLSLVRDTENAYYNLVAARERLRIGRLSLELAQRLVDENTARRLAGLLTDLDVLNAEVGVANARRTVIQAEQTVRNTEDSLLGLFAPGDFDDRPGAVAFEEYKPEPVSFAVSYKMARDNYPDTLSAEQRIKQLEMDLAIAKRAQLPTLTLNASMRFNTTDSSYSDAVTSLPNDHGDARTIGFQYNMPWGMRADKSRYRTAIIQRDSQKVRLEQLEQTLLVQVRSAVRAVETNAATVEIAAKATELSAKQYELQKARFDSGLSTSRLVLIEQDNLESARVNELSSKVALRAAIAELHRLEGTSLERFKIQLPY
ncbi:MAG: TolC family protein [Opitutaceae bacterium]